MKTRKLVLHVLLSVALLIMGLNCCFPLAAGGWHTVGIEDDGTVVAVGNNDYGQCNVAGWTNITQVAAGYYHTVGLKDDGTVVAVGNNAHGQCDVDGWTDITQIVIAAGGYHTVGLKDDRTVVAVGNNAHGQCDIDGWTDITQVAAGGYHTVGLKDDGTVVAVGLNSEGQCDVSGWTDIIGVAAGSDHTVGGKDDRTVVAVGNNAHGQCDVDGWTDIALAVAGGYHTVGVKDDGTVVAVGDNDYGQCDVDGWTDIALVVAGFSHTVGLKPDGTVVAVGDNDYGQCNVDDWILKVDEAYPTLTISSTAGGSVTTPGEGTFEYDEAGEVVKLVATPATGYRFVNWDGDVGTIANVNAATTTITMEGHYEITARFLAGVVAAKTETVTDWGIVHARAEADTEVEVDGTATVTVAGYEDNPGGSAPTGFKATGKYTDVYVPDTTEANELEIRLYYTDDEAKDFDEESLRLFWWDGEDWVQCSDSGVNSDSNYMWAKIRNNTIPSLTDLQGTPWGGYGHPKEKEGICFVATAAYGTDTAKEIDILREFRDAVLLPNSLGAGFVSLYYKTSPPIANFISQHEVLRTAVRMGFVDPIVAILNWSHDLWSEKGS